MFSASSEYSFSGSKIKIFESSAAKLASKLFVANDLPEPDLPTITILELTRSLSRLKKSINTGTLSLLPSLIPFLSDTCANIHG